MSVAHPVWSCLAVKDKSEAAYQTSDLLEKRADLMRRWCDYLNRSPNASVRFENGCDAGDGKSAR